MRLAILKWGSNSMFSSRIIFFICVQCVIGIFILYPGQNSGKYLTLSQPKNDFKKKTNLQSSERFWCETYRLFHKSMSKTKGTRKIIYESKHGGLGDQFRGLLTYYMLAVVTQRSFFIKWRGSLHLSEIFETQVSEMFYPNISSTETKQFIVFDSKNSTMKNLLELLASSENIVIRGDHVPPKRNPFWVSAANTHYNSCTALGRKIRKKQYPGQCRRIFHKIVRLPVPDELVGNMILRTMFPLSKKIASLAKIKQVETIYKAADADELKQFFSFKPEITPYVAVHARLGIGINENSSPRFSGVQKNMWNIARCLAKISIRRARKLGKDGLDVKRIYLATDTTQFREIFSDTVHNISKTFSVFWSKTIPRHVGRPRENASKNVSQTEVYREALSEVLIVGGGLDIVCLKSGFCNLAYYYSNNSNFLPLLRWREKCSVI